MSAESAGVRHGVSPPSSVKRSHTEENERVAHFYNLTVRDTSENRSKSPVEKLRVWNAWLKRSLISDTTPVGAFALEIGGGKGGDLEKWHYAQIAHLVLADVAENRVKEAIDRYNAKIALKDERSYKFSAFWIVGDGFHPSLRAELDFVDFFDVVSCQFAMHYAFESETRAKDFLGNVSYKLRPGGYFIGTTPDARVLYRKALESPDGKSFGNKQYRVVFDEKVVRNDSTAEPTGSDTIPASISTSSSGKDAHLDGVTIKNGARYTFWMQEAVDLPEYIVDPDVLVRWCAEVGLELVSMENFQDRHERKWNEAYKQAQEGKDIEMPPSRESLTDETWESFGVYMAFIFRKKGTPKTVKHSRRRMSARSFDPNTDVLVMQPSHSS